MQQVFIFDMTSKGERIIMLLCRDLFVSLGLEETWFKKQLPNLLTDPVVDVMLF
jgi:hypothetical protein